MTEQTIENLITASLVPENKRIDFVPNKLLGNLEKYQIAMRISLSTSIDSLVERHEKYKLSMYIGLSTCIYSLADKMDLKITNILRKHEGSRQY